MDIGCSTQFIVGRNRKIKNVEVKWSIILLKGFMIKFQKIILTVYALIITLGNYRFNHSLEGVINRAGVIIWERVINRAYTVM